MTHDDEFIDRLESYLDDYEGVTPLPDAVRDAVRATLPSIKQGGPHGVPQRFRLMTLQLPNYARYGIAAAAVVAAVAIGASFLGGPSTGGPVADPTPTPSPTSSPTAAPSPDGPASFVDSISGDMAPGEYYLDLPYYPARIEFEVPAGWWHYWDSTRPEESSVHAALVNSQDTGARDGSAWGVSFAVVDDVLVDPCDPSAGFMDASVTESAEALAEAFSSWENFPVVSADYVTLGGYDGTRVELAQEEPCSETLSETLFTTPSGYEFGLELPAHEPFVNQFTFVDVEDGVIVVWTTDFPGTSEFEVNGGAVPDREAHVEDQAQLRDILESIRFVPR